MYAQRPSRILLTFHMTRQTMRVPPVFSPEEAVRIGSFKADPRPRQEIFEKARMKKLSRLKLKINHIPDLSYKDLEFIL